MTGTSTDVRPLVPATPATSRPGGRSIVIFLAPACHIHRSPAPLVRIVTHTGVIKTMKMSLYITYCFHDNKTNLVEQHIFHRYIRTHVFEILIVLHLIKATQTSTGSSLFWSDYIIKDGKYLMMSCQRRSLLNRILED